GSSTTGRGCPRRGARSAQPSSSATQACSLPHDSTATPQVVQLPPDPPQQHDDDDHDDEVRSTNHCPPKRIRPSVCSASSGTGSGISIGLLARRVHAPFLIARQT